MVKLEKFVKLLGRFIRIHLIKYFSHKHLLLTEKKIIPAGFLVFAIFYWTYGVVLYFS